MREFEKAVVLRAVDSKWMDHIDAMDQLRQGIHLRAYGGTDPLREYQFEGYEMFQEMIAKIQEQVAMYVMKAHVETNVKREAVAEGTSRDTNGDQSKADRADRSAVRRRLDAMSLVHAAAARSTNIATGRAHNAADITQLLRISAEHLEYGSRCLQLILIMATSLS